MHVTAIIVAAGAGRRIGGATPKPTCHCGPAVDPAHAGSNLCSARTVRTSSWSLRSELDRCDGLLGADSSLRGRACSSDRRGDSSAVGGNGALEEAALKPTS